MAQPIVAQATIHSMSGPNLCYVFISLPIHNVTGDATGGKPAYVRVQLTCMSPTQQFEADALNYVPSALLQEETENG